LDILLPKCMLDGDWYGPGHGAGNILRRAGHHRLNRPNINHRVIGDNGGRGSNPGLLVFPIGHTSITCGLDHPITTSLSLVFLDGSIQIPIQYHSPATRHRRLHILNNMGMVVRGRIVHPKRTAFPPHRLTLGLDDNRLAGLSITPGPPTFLRVI
jgi:hypothetical protein